MSKKKIVIGVVLVVFFGLAISISRAKAKTSPFKVETVESGQMALTISASGEVKAEKDATLQFQTGGLLTWVGVKKGDWVKRGQSIASLDTRDLKKRLQKSLNLYLSQRDDFEQTQEDYKSIIESYLLTDEIRRTLDKTQNSLDNSVLDVEITDLAIKLATINAPFEGVVVSDVPYAGVNVLPTTASFRVVDPKSVYFEILIDETDVSRIKVGDKAKVKLDAFPEQVFEATVSKIDFNFSLSSGGGTAYKTVLTFSGPKEQLRLGMNGDAEIIQKTVDNALLVPLSALSEKEGKTYVWRLERSKAKKVEIQVNQTNDDFAQITGGLAGGDKVITSGLSLVKEGMAIKP